MDKKAFNILVLSFASFACFPSLIWPKCPSRTLSHGMLSMHKDLSSFFAAIVGLSVSASDGTLLALDE